MERYNESEPVNLGSGKEISIQDLVHLIARLTGFEGEIAWDTSKPDGQPRRCLDTTKAEKLFGFRARTPSREGLRRMIEMVQVYNARWRACPERRRRVKRAHVQRICEVSYG